LLHSGKAHGLSDTRESFREGAFKVNFLTESCKLIKLACRFNVYCETHKTRSFIEALEIILENKDHEQIIDEMLQKLGKHGLTIEKRSTPKEYLTHLEDLYNYRNSKRRRIW
jgi:hypothetical protein